MKEKKSSFRGKVSKNAQKQKQAGASYGYLNLPKGAHMYGIDGEPKSIVLDFLPYIVTDHKHPDMDANDGIAVVGSEWYRRGFKVHRNVGSDRDNSTVICPTSIGKKCPICEHQKKRFDDGAPKEETKELYPRSRFLYVVVPIDQAKYEAVPHIWDVSQFLFQDTLTDELDRNDVNEIFPDLAEGKTLTLNLKWKPIPKSDKKFAETRSIDFEDREPYPEAIRKEIPSLDDMLHVLSYEEIYNKFFEIEEDDAGALKEVADDEGDTDSSTNIVPERTRKTTTRTAAPAPEPEPEKDPPPTWEELSRIDRANMIILMDAYDLQLNPDDYEDSDAGDVVMRKAIADAIGIEQPAPRRAAAPRQTPPTPPVEKEVKHTPTRGTYTTPAPATRTPAPAPSRTAVVAATAATGGRTTKTASASATEQTCPSGYVFGVDTERYDACDTCPILDDCIDAKKAKAKK